MFENFFFFFFTFLFLRHNHFQITTDWESFFFLSFSLCQSPLHLQRNYRWSQGGQVPPLTPPLAPPLPCNHGNPYNHIFLRHFIEQYPCLFYQAPFRVLFDEVCGKYGRTLWQERCVRLGGGVVCPLKGVSDNGWDCIEISRRRSLLVLIIPCQVRTQKCTVTEVFIVEIWAFRGLHQVFIVWPCWLVSSVCY